MSPLRLILTPYRFVRGIERWILEVRLVYIRPTRLGIEFAEGVLVVPSERDEHSTSRIGGMTIVPATIGVGAVARVRRNGFGIIAAHLEQQTAKYGAVRGL